MAGVARRGAHRGGDAVDQRMVDPTLRNVGDAVRPLLEQPDLRRARAAAHHQARAVAAREPRRVEERAGAGARPARRTPRARRARAARSRARRSAGSRGRAGGGDKARRSRAGTCHARRSVRGLRRSRCEELVERVFPFFLAAAPASGSASRSRCSRRPPRGRAPRTPGRRPRCWSGCARTGPHAVSECAAEQHRRGRPLAAIARDASDSLDRLNAELGVREVRPVFRRADGRPLAAQRASLAARARARRAALPPQARAALPEVPELADVYAIRLAAGRRRGGGRGALCGGSARGLGARERGDDARSAPERSRISPRRGAWGQPYEDLWGILRVRAPEAWDLSLGAGITVAVNDTGIDTHHPDLAANLWVNSGEDLDGNGVADPGDRNGVDDDGNGFVDDLNGFDFANSRDANGDGDFDDPGDVSDAGSVRRFRPRHARRRDDRCGRGQRDRRGRRCTGRAAHGGEGSARRGGLARHRARARDGLRGGQRRARDQQQLVVQCALSEQPGGRGGAGLRDRARRGRGHVGGQSRGRRRVLQPEAAPRQHRGRRERRQRSACAVLEPRISHERARARLGRLHAGRRLHPAARDPVHALVGCGVRCDRRRAVRGRRRLPALGRDLDVGAARVGDRGADPRRCIRTGRRTRCAR